MIILLWTKSKHFPQTPHLTCTSAHGTRLNMGLNAQMEMVHFSSLSCMSITNVIFCFIYQKIQKIIWRIFNQAWHAVCPIEKTNAQSALNNCWKRSCCKESGNACWKLRRNRNQVMKNDLYKAILLFPSRGIAYFANAQKYSISLLFWYIFCTLL